MAVTAPARSLSTGYSPVLEIQLRARGSTARRGQPSDDFLSIARGPGIDTPHLHVNRSLLNFLGDEASYLCQCG